MIEKYPNELEMEKHLLSAMMLKDGEVIPEVVEILKASDLYRPEHQMIFAAIVTVYEETGHCDVLAVQAELEKRKQMTKVKLGYLLSLIDRAFTTLYAVRQAKAIREKSQARQLIVSCLDIAEKAGEGVVPIEELIVDAESKIQATANVTAQRAEDLVSILVRTYEEIGKRAKSGDSLLGTDTGFLNVNMLTGGLRKSDLIILAARPSMGKTALALNIATAASLKVPTLIFSLEMSKEQLGQRLFSSASRVNATRIQNGTLTDNEWSKVVDALEHLERCQMHIDDTRGLTLPEIRMRAKWHRKQHGLGLIVVDYIQLIQGSKEYKGNRVQEVSEISRGLKALAGDLDVPILALSQLSRSVETRADKRPQLSDLRESGSIEQDADIVMFLYREEYYNRDESDNQNIAELIVAKNRNGKTGSVSLRFEPEYVLFSEVVRRG